MPSAPQLDSHVQVVTPENIAFEYRVASPFERGMALLIDVLVCLTTFATIFAVSLAIFGAAGVMGFGLAIGLIVAFALVWFYGGFFETVWNGQTPGKRALGLRVVQVDGRPINALQAVLRNFCRGFDMLPDFSHLLGLVAMTCNQRYQRVGDIVCGTMVVSEDRSLARRPANLADIDLTHVVNLLPANVYPSRSLTKVLVQYVDRRRVFGPARRAEIARHVGQMLVERYGLPPDTDHDTLLCSLYLRAHPADGANRLPVS
jgi:uncharacterized RDD family membrane protein YckC